MKRSTTVTSDLMTHVSDWSNSAGSASRGPHRTGPSVDTATETTTTPTATPPSKSVPTLHTTISRPLADPSKNARNVSANFSELDFMDSGLGRSLTSDLPVLGLQDELDSLDVDDLFVEDYLLSKLQDAQRRLQEVRDYKTAIGEVPLSGTNPATFGPSGTDWLFVSSFRLPLTAEIGDDGLIKSTSSGASLGLVSAFKYLWARMPIRWLGAPGQTVHDAEHLPPHQRAEMHRQFKTARSRKAPGMLSYVPLLPPEEEAAAHQEFCSSVLWPLLHYIPFNLGERSYHIHMFRAYVRVNRFYANAIIDEWRRSDVDEKEAMFWIHDFQLCLVPKMLRELLPNARIGFFLHTPFPTREVFRTLAPRKELLEGMLGADLLGFHTYDYARHFLSTCERVLGLRVTPDAVDNKGVDVHIAVYPFGIDTDTFIAATRQNAVMEMTARLKQSLAGKKIVVGVDRLDYIKGIPHKLLAIEHFLEHHPEWIGRVVFLQVTTPSTSASLEYHMFRGEILEMVGRINGRFSTIEDTPIHYREVHMTLEELCSLYSSADVAMITSIRDGMNLVSYEYIVCQKGSNGVLILSEFAGAAKNLPGAVLVNPWDVEGVSDAIFRSLEMAEVERELRHHKLYRHVVKHTAAAWGVSFIDDLVKFSALRNSMRRPLVELPVHKILKTYREAKGKRLFALDYDGTLQKLFCHPELTYPTRDLLDILKRLSSNEQNIVFIMTGRQKATVLEWFEGINLGFAVEHGFSIRWPDHLREKFGAARVGVDDGGSADMATEENENGIGEDEDAYELRMRDDTWDNLVKADELIAMRNALRIAGEYLKDVEETTPATYVSTKESAYSWHFREADPTFVHMRAREVQHTLEEKLAAGPMEVLMGQMVLYVRPRGVHKGVAVTEILKRLCAEGDSPTWLFAAGNDCMDEDMFNGFHSFVKNPDVVVNTCTVGRRTTQAKYYVNEVEDIVNFLDDLSRVDDY